MRLVQDIREIFKKDWKLFLGVNVLYFGMILIGAIIALLVPSTQGAILDFVQNKLAKAGPFPTLVQALVSGNVLLAALYFFLGNFFVGILGEIVLPSLFFPPLALLETAFSGLIDGIALIIPYGSRTPVQAVAHYLTILLEGEGVLVAVFGCTRQAMAALNPQRYGEQSRLKAYAGAVQDTLKLLPVTALLLAISALYEAWETIFFSGFPK